MSYFVSKPLNVYVYLTCSYEYLYIVKSKEYTEENI